MDPFEVAFEDVEELPPDSPTASSVDNESQFRTPTNALPSPALTVSTATNASTGNNEDDDEEEEEDNVDINIRDMAFKSDPDKAAKTQAILSQFTVEQMERYEFFRRSRFKKADMRKLLLSITGMRAISEPMIVAVSATAKMFVGDVVETARMVMTERKDSGPIRPCHIREAYRRLKLEGKVPKKSVPRLF
ncbi:transcription initiation factor TFIID subunit 11-like [Fagus crenata]